MAEAPPDREYAGAPRWVKVSGIVVVVLLVALGILLLVGGDHGPGRHTSSGDAGGQSRPAATEPGGHQPPLGAHSP